MWQCAIGSGSLMQGWAFGSGSLMQDWAFGFGCLGKEWESCSVCLFLRHWFLYILSLWLLLILSSFHSVFFRQVWEGQEYAARSPWWTWWPWQNACTVHMAEVHDTVLFSSPLVVLLFVVLYLTFVVSFLEHAARSRGKNLAHLNRSNTWTIGRVLSSSLFSFSPCCCPFHFVVLLSFRCDVSHFLCCLSLCSASYHLIVHLICLGFILLCCAPSHLLVVLLTFSVLFPDHTACSSGNKLSHTDCSCDWYLSYCFFVTCYVHVWPNFQARMASLHVLWHSCKAPCAISRCCLWQCWRHHKPNADAWNFVLYMSNFMHAGLYGDSYCFSRLDASHSLGSSSWHIFLRLLSVTHKHFVFLRLFSSYASKNRSTHCPLAASFLMIVSSFFVCFVRMLQKTVPNTVILQLYICFSRICRVLTFTSSVRFHKSCQTPSSCNFAVSHEYFMCWWGSICNAHIPHKIATCLMAVAHWSFWPPDGTFNYFSAFSEDWCQKNGKCRPDSSNDLVPCKKPWHGQSQPVIKSFQRNALSRRYEARVLFGIQCNAEIRYDAMQWVLFGAAIRCWETMRYDARVLFRTEFFQFARNTKSLLLLPLHIGVDIAQLACYDNAWLVANILSFICHSDVWLHFQCVQILSNATTVMAAQTQYPPCIFEWSNAGMLIPANRSFSSVSFGAKFLDYIMLCILVQLFARWFSKMPSVFFCADCKWHWRATHAGTASAYDPMLCDGTHSVPMCILCVEIL